MYSRRGDLACHLQSSHYDSWSRALVGSLGCSICQETLGCLPVSDLLKHITRHMEEVAFGVVNRPHAEWSYDETSSLVQ